MEVIFLTKKKNLTKDDKAKLKHGYNVTFINALSFAKNNYWEKVDVKFNPLAKYAGQDYQPELLADEDIESINDLFRESSLEFDDDSTLSTLDRVKGYVEACAPFAKKDKLDSDELIVYNYIHWCCLLNKGYMILEEVEKWVKVNVKETLSIQKEFKIESGDDLFQAKLDLVIIDNNDEKVLVDFKTSSFAYDENSANESVQLGVYSEFEGLEKVAYLVFEKNIRKRDPRVRFQYVEGNINEARKTEIFDDIEASIKKIEKKEFDKNENSCYTYGRCEYIDYCRNGSFKNLEYVKKKEKK